MKCFAPVIGLSPVSPKNLFTCTRVLFLLPSRIALVYTFADGSSAYLTTCDGFSQYKVFCPLKIGISLVALKNLSAVVYEGSITITKAVVDFLEFMQ